MEKAKTEVLSSSHVPLDELPASLLFFIRLEPVEICYTDMS